MRILTLTTLYPNLELPTLGLFIENRLRRIVATGEVSARVVAPTRWFPFHGERFGEWGVQARIPLDEERHGISLTHPRYLTIPRIGLNFVVGTLYWAMLRHVRQLLRAGHDFDLIDSHYFYPDGVAATLVARKLNKPIVISARGSDLNHYGVEFRWLSRMIRWALGTADRTITVSEALRQRAISLGADPDRVHTLRNGVDLEQFQPRDRTSARARFGLDGQILVSVGNLVGHKGHSLAIEALVTLGEAKLLIAGHGPNLSLLQHQARRLGVEDRVRFLGVVPHADLSWLYSAADALVLASSREGWPNVLLESLACGTPVVASHVGGTPEIIRSPAAGRLVSDRTGPGFAAAVSDLLADAPERDAVRSYAAGFGWDEVVRAQTELYRRVLREHARAQVVRSE